MKKIIHCFNVSAPRSKVFTAVATADGLSQWWSTKVTADSKVGGVADFTFVEGFNPDMKITALDEPSVVAWECVAGHEPWKDNRFRFEFREAEAGRTQVFFTQVYARELSDEQYGTYNFNWGYYLESLRLYCENGKGKPFEPSA